MTAFRVGGLALVVGGAVITALAAPYAVDYYYYSRQRPPFRPDITGLGDGGFRVSVRFDSLTVHNTRDGFLGGDGEYDVEAYVQGVKVSLTDASQGGPLCAGWFCPAYPMLDAKEGETFTFDSSATVTVDLRKDMPLALFTVGVELDGCGRRPFPEVTEALLTPPGLTLADVFRNPTLDWNSAVELFQSFALSREECISANPNDDLGYIRTFFYPPSYSAGSHSDLVSDGDFTLGYTINVTEIPPAATTGAPRLP
jgi:hypothetical protein